MYPQEIENFFKDKKYAYKKENGNCFTIRGDYMCLIIKARERRCTIGFKPNNKEINKDVMVKLNNEFNKLEKIKEEILK